MSERVPFPLFELIGPPCTEPGCKGVLVDHLTMRAPREFFRRCATCGAESGRILASDALGYARRTIERVMRGEKLS
jgi:hypothetical protein